MTDHLEPLSDLNCEGAGNAPVADAVLLVDVGAVVDFEETSDDDENDEGDDAGVFDEEEPIVDGGATREELVVAFARVTVGTTLVVLVVVAIICVDELAIEKLVQEPSFFIQ